MEKGRLEAFSDGVIAIIITIMVLELKVPHGADIRSLLPLLPVFVSYLLSFIYIGIYWNNHHHTLQIVESVNGAILWANMHLLFWLSLIPFVTAWMGENHFAEWPVTCYGIVLIMCSLAYALFLITLIRHHGDNSLLAQAIGKDRKGAISTIIYAVAIIASFFNSKVGFALYIVVACIWFIPDKRIEKKINR
ncbi:TMEM175 family protein [Mucilaginibacter sp.]|uniref:TMEM175 family protein n=1 Tax=Mucilaginibacter sp. TaxID=1882438 RepID=UPI00262EE7FA|nr:TMEM175 family protein [Mucilaginibacter sp.]MDB4918258.1 putative rane protein [Mucilaginibacter sp.]